MQGGTTKDRGLYNKPSAAVHPGALAAGTLPQCSNMMVSVWSNEQPCVGLPVGSRNPLSCCVFIFTGRRSLTPTITSSSEAIVFLIHWMYQRFQTIKFIVLTGAEICLPNGVWVRFLNVLENERNVAVKQLECKGIICISFPAVRA